MMFLTMMAKFLMMILTTRKNILMIRVLKMIIALRSSMTPFLVLLTLFSSGGVLDLEYPVFQGQGDDVSDDDAKVLDGASDDEEEYLDVLSPEDDASDDDGEVLDDASDDEDEYRDFPIPDFLDTSSFDFFDTSSALRILLSMDHYYR